MSAVYAAKTKIPIERSKAEIERMLTRWGADAFASGWQAGSATLMFEVRNRRIRFKLPMPTDKDFRSKERLEKEQRRRWRCLALAIKAKLECVSTGITSFEEEFLAHIVLPTGETFGDWAGPQLIAAYERGAAMPPLLGPGP